MTEGNSELLPTINSSRRHVLKAAGTIAAGLVAKKVIDSVQIPAANLIDSLVTPRKIEQLPENEVNNEESDFFVIMPGLGGSAEDLTYLRGLMDKKYGAGNNFVFSSITEPQAYANKELGNHYKGQAEKTAKAAGKKDLEVLGHSLGGPEMLEFAKEILKSDWKGGSLRLDFYVSPGLGITGASSLVDALKRIQDMSARFGEFDQHILDPLDESYYQGKTLDVPQGFKLIPDTKEARKTRRNEFRTLAANNPEVISEDPSKPAEQVVAEIDSLTQRIKQTTDPNEVDKILTERGLLLRHTLDYLAAGKYIPAGEHAVYLQRYGEDVSQLSRNVLWVRANLLSSLGKLAINQAKGVDETLAEIVRIAERKGVKVDVNLVRAEHDLALTAQDVKVLKTRLSQRQLGDLVKTMLFLENEGHTTFGYTSVVPEKILPNT
ncbi:hypothetical protein HYT02_04140 [Candidatus Gottesmanbacteria bacterium]|nr:hypothetical protein [Candidatus Gottesmanbacteria bacterium]